MNAPIDREVAVFSAARRLAAGERAAYLDETCAGDAALRQRVENLLRASEEAETFLQSPALGAQRSLEDLAPANPLPNVTAPGERAGDRIGRYKLLQQIGEGGCGVVYMAEQEEPVRRRVALKVIKLGMDTKQVVARFEAERQALALMDHPNIAKVLEAGATATGRPYFVMELVRGIKITHYCDENNLSTEERLDLFIKVSQAVQHAHQKGIIHRDLKPSNILVADHDGVPVPKIIDFGIAKATTDQRLTDKTLFTAFEQFIGTPAYMSPEQARMSGLDIDTRTDIYSLGVLLYELLTGKTPFDTQALLAAGLDEMRRTISEQEPARPSTRLSTMLAGELTTTAKHRRTDAPKLVHLLRGDLDWIVMKALEKDRARRYDTANGLAMDIQRYLADEAIVARPPGNFYRFQKLVRRNKLVFAAIGAVAAALLIGLTVSTWLLLREREARRSAIAAEKKAQTEANKSQQVADFLKKMLQGVGPSVAMGRDTTMLQEMLRETAKRVSADLTNQPEVSVDLCLTLAETYHDLEQYKEMEGVARQSLQLARRMGETNESVAFSLTALGDALQHIGEWHLGSLDEAAKSLDEAERCSVAGLAMTTNLLGGKHPKVPVALIHVANIFASQGKLPEAERMQRQALALYQELIGPECPQVAKAMFDISLTLSAQPGKSAEAETLSRQALAMQKKLLGPIHPEVAKTLRALGRALTYQGKPGEAETSFKEALAMWENLKAKDRLESAGLLSGLGSIFSQQNKLAEAETSYSHAITLLKKLVGQEHPNVAWNMDLLGSVLQQQGKLAEAESILRQSLAIQGKLPAKEFTDGTVAIHSLAEVLRGQRRFSELTPLYHEALAMQKKRYGNEHYMVVATMDLVADLLRQDGKLEDAEKMYRDALKIGTKLADQFIVVRLFSGLAGVLVEQGRLGDAEAAHREAFEIARQKSADNEWLVSDSAYQLGWFLKQHGKSDEAEALFPKAVERMPVCSLNDRAWHLATEPDAKLRNGAWAVVLAEKAVAATSRTNHSWLDTLAAAYAEAGQFTNAVRAQQEAVALVDNEQWKKAYVCRVRLYQSNIAFREPSQVETMLNNLLSQRKLTEAEPLARELLAWRELELPNELVTIQLRSLLGGCLLEQKKFAEAESVLLSSYQAMKERESQIAAKSMGRLVETTERLIKLYEATGQPEQVTEWKKRHALVQAEAQIATEAATRRDSGAFHGRNGRWKEAAAELNRLVELARSDDYDQFQLAVLLVQLGDLPGYRAHCQKMVTRFGSTNDPGPLDKIAKACLLAADPGFDLETSCQLADRAVTLGKGSDWLYYFQFGKGLAEYRAGRFASAVDWVTKSIGQPRTVGGTAPDWNRDGAAYPVLAMAQYQLKHLDEARAALAKATDIVNTKLPNLENGILDEDWVDWLIAHILLREAKALLELPSATPKE